MKGTATVLMLAVSLLAGCKDDPHPRSKTFHCKDGTSISGPGAHAGQCDSHGGLG